MGLVGDMGDVLPPRRQAVVDRLRRRFELYRRHGNVCLSLHENSTNGINEQHRRDTLLLRQKFLEAKAKKSKKNEHRSVKEPAPVSPKIISHPKPQVKAPSESSPATATADTSTNDTLSVSSTENTLSNHKARDQPPLPNFAVQIVQQYNNSNSTPSQTPTTVQNKGMVQALSSGAVTKCNSPVSIATANQNEPKQQQQALQSASQFPQQPQSQPKRLQTQEQIAPISPEANDMECQQEKQVNGGDLSKKTSSSSGSAGRLSDAFPSIDFAEDSTDGEFYPDLLNLIDDVFTNSADLMKEFNFEDSAVSVKDHNGLNEDVDSSIADLAKGPAPSSPQLQTFSGGNGVFDSSQPNSSQQAVELYSTGTVSSPTVTVLTTSTTATPSTTGSYPPPVRLQTYGNPSGTALNISSGLGLDFKLTEPSPAALTLKQMAEQHQNMQQKHQHLNMRLGSPPNVNRTPCNQENFGDHLATRHSAFMKTAGNSLSSYSKGPSQNGLFNPGTFDPPYPGVEPLQNVFKQEACINGMGNHLCEATPQQSQQSGLHLHPLSNGRTNVMNLKSSAYGATIPLTHYTDPMEQTSLNRPGQYNTSLPTDTRVQMTQVHSVSPDVKQQSPNIQNTSNLYSNFHNPLVNNPHFQSAMPQQLPYNSQFGGGTGLARPSVDYQVAQSEMVTNSMPTIDQSRSSSRTLYAPTKNNFPLHLRPSNMIVNSDRLSMPAHQNEWRRGMLHQHQNSIRMEGYPPQGNYSGMVSESSHMPAMARPLLHPQYRLIEAHMDASGRLPRSQMAPPDQTVMSQRQQMTLHASPVNPSLPSTGVDMQLVSSLPRGAATQTSVPGQVYSHPDITRQEGHHINLDFLDNFESIASDFLNFDQGNGAHFPLLDDMEMLRK